MNSADLKGLFQDCIEGVLSGFPVCQGVFAAGEIFRGIRTAGIFEGRSDLIVGIEDHARIEGDGGPVFFEVFLLGIGEAVDFCLDRIGEELGIHVGGIDIICPLKEHDGGGSSMQGTACGLSPAGALDECLGEY